MSRSIWLGAAAAFLGGIAVALQAALLGGVGRQGGALRAGLVTYAAGGLLAIAVLFVLGTTPGAAPAPGRASWALGALAGSLGVAVLTSLAYASGRISLAAALALLIVGQMLTAMVLDLLGLSGSTVAVDSRRLVGLALLGGGTWLLLPR